jgi:DNA-binding Xre family transcriptional regulator
MTTEQRRRRLNELCAKAGMAPAEMQALTAKHRSVRAAIASICSRRDDDDLDIE